MVNSLLRMTDFDRLFVGWDRIHNELANINGLSRGNYPRYNLIKGDNKYRIEMGLAGWDRDSIKITQDKGTLTIEGVDKQELNIEKANAISTKGLVVKLSEKYLLLENTLTFQKLIFQTEC